MPRSIDNIYHLSESVFIFKPTTMAGCLDTWSSGQAIYWQWPLHSCFHRGL